MKQCLIIFFLAITLFECNSSKTVQAPPNHKQQIEDWKNQRFLNLYSPTGWLSLIGLEWFEEGENTFGAHPDNAVQFPISAPMFMGSYFLDNGVVHAELLPDSGVTTGEDGVSEMSFNALQWFVINRGDRWGIRMRDTLQPSRILPPRIPYYPVDESYYVAAKFKPSEENASMMMRNVLDMDVEVAIAGTLQFMLGEKEHEIIALDGGPDHLFLIIEDETTGEVTYGGGRYLYCPRPEKGNKTIIDFNKAYNPPCAFTEYATCLLPPAQNYIPVSIRAGEQVPFGGH